MKFARSTAFWFGFALLAFGSISVANANSLTISYFTIDPSDPDINAHCCSSANNEVLNTLGPNGFPMLNPAYVGAGGPIHDVTSSGEITWWSPALNSHVQFTGSATVTLPFNVPVNFFPPNGTGTSDASGYQAAILSGTLNVPTSALISFGIGADDSAFAYLDGNAVCDLGGVHGFGYGSCVTPFVIGAGSHTLQVFFDDLNASQSGLYFDVTTEGVTTDPTPTSVPEPATLALLGIAFVGFGFRSRKMA